MANANLFQAYLQPARSVVDYENDYAKADALKNQNALQSLGLQQQQAATAQSLKERNALQQIAAQYGGDRNTLISGLRNSGLPGLMAQADALEQGGAKLAETNSVVGKNNADTKKNEYDLHQAMVTHGLQSVLASSTPQLAAQAAADGVQQGYWSMADAQKKIAAIPQDQAQYAQWRLQQLGALVSAKDQLDASKPVLGTTNTGGATNYTSRDPFTGAVTQNGSVAMTATPGETMANGLGYSRLAEDKRHNGATEANSNGQVTYQTDANGNMVAVPSRVAPGTTVQGQAVVDSSGKVIPGKSNLTETQGKATTFAARMADAESTIKAMESKGVSGSDMRTIAAGNGLTNWLASPEGQQYRQAQENWVTANLRLESGAAIGKDEKEKDIRKFFPVPGDSDEVKAQKAQARAVAQQGMLVQAGQGATQVPGILQRATAQPPASAGVPADIQAIIDRHGKK